jgi:hypothetical protein
MPNKLVSYNCLAGILLFFAFAVSADPLVNSWTNPMSAPWEGGTNWSLGQLPASNQWIMITNDGYKGVGISAATASNFPASMTVSNLTISAPPNALSTLLLNYSGTTTPLRVLNGCTIGTNGSLDNFHGAFEVDSGQWNITNGQFSQEGGTTLATNARTSVVGGSMNLTNGDVKLGPLLIGTVNGSATNSSVTQVGGAVECTLVVQAGSYSFLGGSFSGECYVSGDKPVFSQYGGTNYASIGLGPNPYFYSDFGTYTLYDGAILASTLRMATGFFYQEGGFVSIASFEIGGGFQSNDYGSYTLSNGILRMGSFAAGNGRIVQAGGECTISNTLGLYGAIYDYGFSSVSYSLSGGALFCLSIDMGGLGGFDQSGGTNVVVGDLTFNGSGYGLSAGLLVTSNTVVEPTYVNQFGDHIFSEFFQTGGEHRVSNTLSDYDQYLLSGGTLSATNIVLRGILSVSNSAVILNPGLFDFGGELELFDNVNESLGGMLLSANSSIDLENGAHTLAFQNSSSLVWSNGWTLTVSNWTGLTNGGGSDQLLFGNNSSGLTQAQLHRIQFVNPSGFPAGVYPATILGTGEVVPAQRPMLLFSRNLNGLVLNWSGSFVLQSATNVQGPYSDVTNATSPYTNLGFQLPRQFFRLRQ